MERRSHLAITLPKLVECPHCHRRFRAELLGPRSPRQAGFKCPHCRLFVSYDRADPKPGA